MITKTKLELKKLFNKFTSIYFQNAPFPEFHLSLAFRYKTGRKLVLNKPRFYDDKMQWIKLNYKDPLIVQCNDKVKVRDYIRDKGYGYLLNDVINVYNCVEDIDIDSLPESFVLKANHGSSWNIICHDKSKMNWRNELSKMDLWINSNYCNFNYEWGYKDIEPKIICEKYLGDESGNPPKDYKFFCFDGIPRVVAVDIDRFKEHKRNIYDMNWNFIDCRINFMNDKNRVIEKPKKFEEMKEIASKLSEDFPHVRVDLYEVKGKLYFSELTFYNGSGMSRLLPESFELQMGQWITIV